MADEGFDHEVDVLVAGSGAGGFATALAARAEGLDVLMVEKAPVYGGSTAYSGGGAWIPNHPVLVAQGERDDPEQVLRYLIAIAGERVAHDRLRRYVDEAPRMASFLMSQSRWLADGFVWYRGYSDYHPDRGGNPAGRGVWPKPIDLRELGDDAARMRLRPITRGSDLPTGAWMTSEDFHDLIRLRWGTGRGVVARGFLRLLVRMARYRLLGERMITSGAALVIRLRLTQLEKDIPLWLDTPVTELVRDDSGAVIGAVVRRDGAPTRVRTRRGVMIATGGFDHDAEMRARHQPEVELGWSFGSEDNRGDGIRVGEAVGAATDLMDDAWWMPGFLLPPGAPAAVAAVLAERQFPGQYIVNAAGRRFVSEAAPYTDFGHAQIEGHRTGVSHIPAFMIFDSRYRARNFFMGRLPGRPLAPALFDAGIAFQADTIEELAARIGVPADALRETHERFNRFARAGVDEDFHRGETAYENYYGDPTRPNPNLAPVDAPPYFAFKMVPGDLGTKGGLLTNADAQVLRPDGTVIAGLYATGNTSAAVMGNDYAGPGATIGPAMTFGYVGARHMAAASPTATG
jgi:succinate dehydrogenase/fumarate reductase flavoprotein subunit